MNTLQYKPTSRFLWSFQSTLRALSYLTLWYASNLRPVCAFSAKDDKQCKFSVQNLKGPALHPMTLQHPDFLCNPTPCRFPGPRTGLYFYKQHCNLFIYIIFDILSSFQMESLLLGSSRNISFLLAVMILKACNDLSRNTNIMHHSDRITMPPCQGLPLNTTHLLNITVISTW